VIELIPETYVAPLDLLATFGRIAPLHVDLGCGDGSFLCELAARCPQKNFLGIERLVGRVAKACRKAAGLDNVRVIKVESSYAVRYLLPEASVETFYLLFPDPWPKRRHHRHRIVKTDFLDSIHRALTEDGFFRIATDQLNYFDQISQLARTHSGFEIVDFNARSARTEFPPSTFERRFREQNLEVYRLALRKVSPVT
jgi:tRNA (guanine-N7-)-methyltransferase